MKREEVPVLKESVLHIILNIMLIIKSATNCIVVFFSAETDLAGLHNVLFRRY